MYDEFKSHKITEKFILDQIDTNQKKVLHNFDSYFNEKIGEEDEIKFLKRLERTKIMSKTLVTITNAKYEI